MISLRLAHVRLSPAGAWAGNFPKLFTSGTLRVRLMSSNTARTSGDACAYSIGPGLLMTTSRFCAIARRQLYPFGSGVHLVPTRFSGQQERLKFWAGLSDRPGSASP